MIVVGKGEDPINGKYIFKSIKNNIIIIIWSENVYEVVRLSIKKIRLVAWEKCK